MPAPPDYYEVLQVSPNADGEVIQAAYRRLVEKWHSERTPGDLSAFRRLSLLDEAYAVLSDPQKRQEYDRQREQPTTCGAVRAEPSASTAVMQQDVVSAAWGSGPYNQRQQVLSKSPRQLDDPKLVKPHEPPKKKESEWSKLKAGVITLLSLMAVGAPLQCRLERNRREMWQQTEARNKAAEQERLKKILQESRK